MTKYFPVEIIYRTINSMAKYSSIGRARTFNSLCNLYVQIWVYIINVCQYMSECR